MTMAEKYKSGIIPFVRAFVHAKFQHNLAAPTINHQPSTFNLVLYA